MTMKKVPCEECRNQKRKCNGLKPCERCYKFDIDCVYSSSHSPVDEEFIQIAVQTELLKQAESLETEIANMEKIMKRMKNQGNSTPSLTNDSDRSMTDEFPSSPSTALSFSSESVQHSKLIAVLDNGTQAILKKGEKKSQPWILNVKKGDFCIDTHINNYSDLFNNLYCMLQSVEYGSSIPPVLENYIKQDNIVSQLVVLIRKKYGKTQCKNVAKSIRIFTTPKMSNVNTIVTACSPENIQVTTNKLIQAYLRCQHFQQLAIHVPTFVRCFLDTRESAAAMALCATICTLRCNHIAGCLPSDSLVEYGKFYFKRARDALETSFDQFNLESFTAYVFMAVYTLTISEIEKGKLYTDMAERISVVLQPKYAAIFKMKRKSATFLQEKGEAVHFSRLLNHLRRVQTFEEITRAQLPDMKKDETNLPYCTLTHSEEGKWEIAEDDSIQEKWFAQMHSYILLLQRTEHKASKCAYSSDLYHLVGLIGHQVEMAMRHWYTEILPLEFRLSLPLFDSTISCQEFYSTLERECSHSVIPVLTTLVIYEEWLVMAQSYLPKSIPQPENEWKLLKMYWNGGNIPKNANISRKWRKRIQKILDLRARIEFEGTDEEYYAMIGSFLGSHESHIQKHIVITGVHAAFNTVRLIKYLRSRSTDCYFDMRVLINAWQLLLNISKVQIMMPPEITEYIPRIHKYLSTCLAIVHDELRLQPYQGKVGDYVEIMERELKNQMVEEDDCDCVACPDA
ncbi:hypothetical protein G6F62_006672 [Rhizopus arrhizus]|nr:hypothetical protein G6F23_006972 [Rhizopus arrhizus]KAG0792826.1 hypothetical protein G6F21_004075 [Rhizopus arrhizus]KAG0814017.1 hypothetical protein G6F20_005111 [Rhizopus arrhizus]KAG0834096.1 hypothetical protein G6F19_005386 [Rhizopus arrhizus]KAG0836617.1 hypothetical protein G6F18_005268 [Rhizopus arrhizus]